MSASEGFPGEGVIDLTGLSSEEDHWAYATGDVASGLSVNSEIFYPTKSTSAGLAEYGNDGWWFASVDGTTYAACVRKDMALTTGCLQSFIFPANVAPHRVPRSLLIW